MTNKGSYESIRAQFGPLFGPGPKLDPPKREPKLASKTKRHKFLEEEKQITCEEGFDFLHSYWKHHALRLHIFFPHFMRVGVHMTPFDEIGIDFCISRYGSYQKRIIEFPKSPYCITKQFCRK